VRFVKQLIPAAIALVGPPLAMACYLWIGRGGQSEIFDDLAVGGPVFLGLIPLNMYRLRWFFRIPLNLIYLAGMTYLNFALAFSYVCGKYHSCL
jgi:hypothetical protein